MHPITEYDPTLITQIRRVCRVYLDVRKQWEDAAAATIKPAKIAFPEVITFPEVIIGGRFGERMGHLRGK